MTEPTTVNTALIVPNTGDLPGAWGSAALNPDLNAIDGFLGGSQTISVSNANITLTAPAGSITPSGGPTQSQNAMLIFTGAMTGNVQVTLPLPGYMAVANFTTGNFVLTFAAASSGLVVAVEQGSVQRIVNNGTNVWLISLPAVGSYLDTCDLIVPAWVNACSVPPYLLCNGGTFSSATYPYLYAKLGNSTTLPDARGRNRYMLGLGTGRLTTAGAGIDGTTLLAAGGNNGINLVPLQIPAGVPAGGVNSITVLTGTHSVAGLLTPGITSAPTTGGVAVPFDASGAGNITFFTSFSGNNTINVSSTNAGQTIVPSTTPGYVGGITMIRAA